MTSIVPRALAVTACATLSALVPSCSLVPHQSDRLQIERISSAVLPFAEVALETGQLETAKRSYQNLLRVDPDSFQARMGLGKVELRRRAPAEASRWFISALASARALPERHDALLAHGRAALDAGQLEAARGSFARLTDPQEGASNEHVAFGLNGVGLTFMIDGDLRSAVTLMERAVELLPRDEKLRGNLSLSLRALAEQVAATSTAANEFATSDEAAGQPPRPPPAAGAAPNPELANAASRIEQAVRRFEDAAERLADAASQPPALPAGGNAPAQGAPTQRPRQNDAPPRADTSPNPPPTPTSQQPSQSDAPPRADTSLGSPPTPMSQRPRQSDAPPRADASPNPPPTPAQQPHRSDAVPPATPSPSPQAAPAAVSTPASPPPADSSPQSTLDASVGFLVTDSEGMFVQMGAYGTAAAANATTARLRRVTEQPVRVTEHRGLHRVRIGPLKSRDGLQALMGALREAGFGGVEGVKDAEMAQTEPVEPLTPPADQPATPPESIPAPEPKPSQVPASAVRGFPVDVDGGRFLQMGAYGNRDVAETLARQLRNVTDERVRVASTELRNGEVVHRVRIGPVSEEDWGALAIALTAAGYAIDDPRPANREAFVARTDNGTFVQIGAFKAHAAAASVARQLRDATDEPVSVTEAALANGASIHRVQIGPLASDARLATLIETLRTQEYRVTEPVAKPNGPPVGPEAEASLPAGESPPAAQDATRASRQPPPESQEPEPVGEPEPQASAPAPEPSPPKPPPLAPTPPRDSALDAAASLPPREYTETYMTPDASTAGGPATSDGRPRSPSNARAFVTTEDEGLFVRIGDYDSLEAAQDVRSRMRVLTTAPVEVIVDANGPRPLHRVRVGPVETDVDFEALLAAVEALGFDIH